MSGQHHGEDIVEDCVSAEIPDWSREQPCRFGDPGRKLLLTIQRYQYWSSRRRSVACICKWLVLRHRSWSAVPGAGIPLSCRIGGELSIPHPNGIVIHPGVRIGVNCLIFQQVTLGPKETGVPIVGGHVDNRSGCHNPRGGPDWRPRESRRQRCGANECSAQMRCCWCSGKNY
jgi:serine O-acetyltransferase